MIRKRRRKSLLGNHLVRIRTDEADGRDSMDKVLPDEPNINGGNIMLKNKPMINNEEVEQHSLLKTLLLHLLPGFIISMIYIIIVQILPIPILSNDCFKDLHGQHPGIHPPFCQITGKDEDHIKIRYEI